MFLQVSVCPQGVWYPSMPYRWYPSMPCSRSRGGVPAPRGVPAPAGCLLWGRGACSGGGWVETPPADGYCCGRYASYWNAFLFILSTGRGVYPRMQWAGGVQPPRGRPSLGRHTPPKMLECILVEEIILVQQIICKRMISSHAKLFGVKFKGKINSTNILIMITDKPSRDGSVSRASGLPDLTL